MVTKIQVIHAHDFLRATPEGRLDFEASRTLLVDLVAASAALGDHDVVLDTRDMQSAMSAGELWYLALELARHGGALGRKKAVLCPRARFENAEFFALCAQNRGLNVRAFTSYEEAVEWFAAKDADA